MVDFSLQPVTNPIDIRAAHPIKLIDDGSCLSVSRVTTLAHQLFKSTLDRKRTVHSKAVAEENPFNCNLKVNQGLVLGP